LAVAGAASARAFAYAPFGRRLVALAVDIVTLTLVFVALVLAVDAVAGRPLLVEFWRTLKPINVSSETASRTITKEEGGVVRELVTRRETRVYADGSVRVYAVFDGRLTGSDGVPVASSTERLIGISASAWYARLATGFLAVALAFAYFAAFEASSWQASPGKRALGLSVTDLEGRRLGAGRALARQLFKCLDIASSGLTYLIAGLTERRQGLHDILAGTLVLRAAPGHSAAAPALPSAVA
jgi:uncharacterized RDD family membrane protein YckC